MRLHLKSFELIVIGYQGYKSSFFPFTAYFDRVDCVCHFFSWNSFVSSYVKFVRLLKKSHRREGEWSRHNTTVLKPVQANKKLYYRCARRRVLFFHPFRGFCAPYERKDCFRSGLFKKSAKFSIIFFFKGRPRTWFGKIPICIGNDSKLRTHESFSDRYSIYKQNCSLNVHQTGCTALKSSNLSIFHMIVKISTLLFFSFIYCQLFLSFHKYFCKYIFIAFDPKRIGLSWTMRNKNGIELLNYFFSLFLRNYHYFMAKCFKMKMIVIPFNPLSM